MKGDPLQPDSAIPLDKAGSHWQSNLRCIMTFLFSLILALGSLPALVILTTNSLSFSGMHRYVSNTIYNSIVIYSDVILSFGCVFVGLLFLRSRPLLFALLFTLAKILFRLLMLPHFATLRHFWSESILSAAAAVAAAILATRWMAKIGWKTPVHPIWTGLAAGFIPPILWLIVLRLA